MTNRPSILVFRDKLLLPSEGFIPSHYVGFDRAQPVYLANQLGWRAETLTHDALTTADGVVGRSLYKQFGICANERAIAAHQPVAVHAHFGRGGALALPLARRLGLPLYVTFHGGDATKHTHSKSRLIPSVYQRRLQALQSYASGFLCVSDFVADRLRHLGFPADKLRTHYIGVDLGEMQKPTPRQGNAPYLFVGRLVDKKGVDTLLAALQKLASGTRAALPALEIAGTGPQMDQLRAAAAGQDNVTFLGWQTPDELRHRMARCRGLIVPSREAKNGDCEGLPTVVLEATRAGVPVIASDHAGIPEIIAEGETGLLVPENDVDALASALVRHQTMSSDAVCTMVTKAQSVLARNFDARKQSRRLQDILLATPT